MGDLDFSKLSAGQDDKTAFDDSDDEDLPDDDDMPDLTTEEPSKEEAEGKGKEPAST
jgi:hypothetical protein